jgi:hypothetical protein
LFLQDENNECKRVLNDKVLVLLQWMALYNEEVRLSLDWSAFMSPINESGVQINDLRARQRPSPPPPPVTPLEHGGCFAFYFMHSDEICPQSTFIHSKKVTYSDTPQITKLLKSGD